MPESAMSQLSNRYHDWVRQHPTAAADFTNAIEDVLDDAGVVYDRVCARVKVWPSLKAKAKKRQPDGSASYPDPWDDIHDIVGARITVYHSTVIPQVIDVLATAFEVIRSVDKAEQTRISGGFGYGSHHLIVRVKPTGVATGATASGLHAGELQARDVQQASELQTGELSPYSGMIFEIQIRTVLQHAWAEFEHDIRYKQGSKPPTSQVDRLFTLAAGLIELADQQFDDIAAEMNVGPSTDSTVELSAAATVELSAATLPGVLAMLLGDKYPYSRSDQYRFVEELLAAHGIETLAQLTELLNPANISFVHEKMKYQIHPGQIRLLDDLLLLRYGTEHVAQTATLGYRTDRRRRLNQRLKLLSEN